MLNGKEVLNTANPASIYYYEILEKLCIPKIFVYNIVIANKKMNTFINKRKRWTLGRI